MYEWWNKLPYKYVILVSACLPLLKIETIDEFFNHYLSINNNIFNNYDDEGNIEFLKQKRSFKLFGKETIPSLKNKLNQKF